MNGNNHLITRNNFEQNDQFKMCFPQNPYNPIQAAITKYKAAVNNLVKKIKTIPQHFIKKITGNGLFFDEGDATQQADPVSKPEDESNAEKPADETMAEKPAEETLSDKTEDEAELEATKSNIVGRKLDITNGEILAESETGKTT